jgi:hypothetical protein
MNNNVSQFKSKLIITLAMVEANNESATTKNQGKSLAILIAMRM